MPRSHPFRTALPLLLIALAGTACARDGSRSERIRAALEQRFAAADLDHDGTLSREEADKGMPRLAAHFDEIDSDRDGRIDRDDIVAWFAARRAAR